MENKIREETEWEDQMNINLIIWTITADLRIR